MEVHEKWREIVDKHAEAERKDMNALVKELVPYLKSVGFDLDPNKSYLSKRDHGSDGWRLEGVFTMTERDENTTRSTDPKQVREWVEEATGMYGYPKKIGEKNTGHPVGPVGVWQVEFDES